jgi:biopolymer transport protein ExbB
MNADRIGVVTIGLMLLAATLPSLPVAVHAADAAAAKPDDTAATRAEEALNAPAPASAAAKKDGEKPMSLIELFLSGGPLMWPILVMSLVALAFAIERAFALRRSRFLPRGFIDQLDALRRRTPLEIGQLKKLCDDHPSVVATVVRTLVDKLGRPVADVERAVADAKDREASRLYANIRPITLAASITPLIGLLGTVQGMIVAFHTTANMEAGADRASALAGGIYLALVTTFAGLCVAIPATVVAHALEGRILRGFRDVDALTSKMWRLVERCENMPRTPVPAEPPSIPMRAGRASPT